MTNPAMWSEPVWIIERTKESWLLDDNLQWDCLGNYIVAQLKAKGYEIVPINTKMELDYDQIKERDRMTYG